MLRRSVAVLLALMLCWTTVACGSDSSSQSQQKPTNNSVASVSSGKYPVQQATYDDANGEYTLMLLNTPAGTPPTLRTNNLQMARLTEEQIANGEKTYVEINGDQAVMYLKEDFKIEYVHNVTETRTDPQSGQQETVVVRQQSSFWAPFAGALAGQALGSLLFRPQYYVPPVYQPGGILRGYGGYGSSYNQAIDRYQTKYNAPPAVVRNRQVLRTTGNLRRTPSSSATTRSPSSNNRSTGSGYGSNQLRSSGKSSSTRLKSRSGFGSSSGMRSRGFSRSGGRRR